MTRQQPSLSLVEHLPCTVVEASSIWDIGSRVANRKCANSPDGSMRVMMNRDAPSYHPGFSDPCILSVEDIEP